MIRYDMIVARDKAHHVPTCHGGSVTTF